MTVPGKDNEAKALQKFEDKLYAELWEQHQRIDLFVQSKAGEITRRLRTYSTTGARADADEWSEQCTWTSKSLNWRSGTRPRTIAKSP